MKIIFLDIDGVLNSFKSYYKKDSHVPIDEHKVFLLSQICEKTNAKIVLISSWRLFWEKENEKLIPKDILAIRLEEIFNRYNLKVYDKVSNGYRKLREESIIDWLSNHPEIEEFIIIDDESSFYSTKTLNHLIKTSENSSNCTGLESNHVNEAVKKLK